MIFSRRNVLQSAGASALLAAIGRQAFAQSQLDSVRLITGFAAGGTSDTTCRRVATRLAPEYARTAVVENKTGAGGQIAVQYVKAAAPDGMTVLQTPTSILTIYPHIYKKLPYDPAVDLTPVTLACVFDFGFAVGPAVPLSVKTVPESWPGPRPIRWARTSARRPPVPRRTSSARCWARAPAWT
jgi:tripartite-type tricarboxylate transporter receptor subunit TctC